MRDNNMEYLVPAGRHRIQTEVARSRFITTVDRASSVDDARSFIAAIRREMPDANHHVYAYRVGYGNSVIDGMSDDGEPTGTSGPPTLTVLKGYDIGDVVIVTTRYFGGTKLGTGGLVRAYSEAAHIALNSLSTQQKIDKIIIGLELSYSLYQIIKNLAQKHDGDIDDEVFAADVTMLITLPARNLPTFTEAVRDVSSGKVTPILMGQFSS